MERDDGRDLWDDLGETLRPLRMAYRAEVKSLAREAIRECGDDAEALDRWVHETCDGHEWVIYTTKAQMVDLCSDAGADESDESDSPSVRAFYALHADVTEAIETLRAEAEDAA